ncbi:MAG: hypothetical protein NC191_08560 [Muribaculaceae bacterium]|nr:hypothetical protein [Muribaculaceae bacterium]
MIITRLQNYIEQKRNTNINKKSLPITFTSGIQLNRDIFIPHDSNNANQQYLSTYAPGKNQGNSDLQFYTYSRVISDLDSDKTIDKQWLTENHELIKNVFGLDVLNNPDMQNLFLSELQTNREKIAQRVLQSSERFLEKYYKGIFPTFKDRHKVSFNTFNADTLKKYNFAMRKLDTEGIIPDIPLFYRTTKLLPPVKQLAKYTNANIIDMRDKINLNSFHRYYTNDNGYNYFKDLIESIETDFRTKGQRSIVLLNNIYLYMHYLNDKLYDSAMDYKDNYKAIFVTEDIPMSIRNTKPADKPKFSNIPAYQADKQRFINEIIDPLKNNTADAPKFVILNSKAFPADTEEFILAGLNEVPSNTNYITHTTNINDFEKIITNIKNNAEQNKNDKFQFIVIPQAYKYIATRPENAKLLESLQYSQGQKIIPILYSSYPEKILEKMNIQNNSKHFTLNELTQKDFEELLKLYTSQADDEINELITQGQNIPEIDLNIDYKYLSSLLKNSSYNGFRNIQNLVNKAKESYLLSPKYSFNNYLTKLISGGLYNEN